MQNVGNWKMLYGSDWNGLNFCMALLPFTVVDNVKEGLIFTNLSVNIICPPSSSDELNKTSELFAILSCSYGTEHKIQKLWIVRNATCCNYFFGTVFVIYLQTLFSNYTYSQKLILYSYSRCLCQKSISDLWFILFAPPNTAN